MTRISKTVASRLRPTTEAQQLFRKAFGYQPAFTSSAPGTLELLGNMGSHNEGLVLSLAVNPFVQMAAAPRHDGRIELCTSSTSQREIFWISDIQTNPAAPWADAIKRVLQSLRRQGVPFNGFNAAIYFPISGCGIDLQETAAAQIATALVVRKLYPYKLTETGCLNRPPQRGRRGELPPLTKQEQLALARLCHKAGTDDASMTRAAWPHYIACLGSKSFHVVAVDCRFKSIELIPMAGEAVFVICPSGISDSQAAEHLEQRLEKCRSAAKKLHTASLRSVDPPFLSAHRMNLSPEEYGCAYHVVGETQRVVFAERALHEGDFIQFGQYLTQSHESSRDFFQNSCLELDLLVSLALDHPGCLGARLSGMGFGGFTINLVSWNLYESFIQTVAHQYEMKTGHRIKPVVCRMEDGAQ